MSAYGRERTLRLGNSSAPERPVWANADIRPGRLSALPGKMYIRLDSALTSANDT